MATVTPSGGVPTASVASGPQITLYWLSESRAQSFVWLLEELGLPYNLELFYRTGNRRAPAEMGSVHPLGKSPVVKILPAGAPAGSEPIVLAESGFVVQYLCDHFARGPAAGLVPLKWKSGMEGVLGGETEAWKRWAYLLHYSEGSLMPLLVVSMIVGRLRSSVIPFFVRPITSMAANRIADAYSLPNARKHLAWIDSLLASSPEGGPEPFLCGPDLTAADILISFPILVSRALLDEDDHSGGFWQGGSVAKEFPRVYEYLARMKATDGYKRAAERVRREEEKLKARP